ncbi:MAG TPA: FAD-dependent oxidoreductase, partial [Acidimicrobiales bacterium]|nr:FAD-dependent oxidoreductase [Acidimicrobiales bacterium]
ALVDALLVAVERTGVTVVRGGVKRLTVAPDGGRVVGVVIDAAAAGAAASRPVDAGTVVLAAGCATPLVPGVPDVVRLPVRPIKGQILTLAQPAGDPLLSRTVRGIVRGGSVYLVPRDDGRVVVGATVEERGWDTTPTAGGAYELLRDALALVPGLDDAAFVAARAGLRPGSPDDLPMIGATAVPGLVVATGHHRNGVLLTPVTAEAVAAVVAGGALPDEVTPCDPRRFAGRPAEVVT